MYFISFRTTHTLYYQTLLTSVVHRSSHSERKVDSGGKEREREKVAQVRDEDWGWGVHTLGLAIPHIKFYVIVIARVLGIYGSKPTRVRGRSPRTRAVYVAINP